MAWRTWLFSVSRSSVGPLGVSSDPVLLPLTFISLLQLLESFASQYVAPGDVTDPAQAFEYMRASLKSTCWDVRCGQQELVPTVARGGSLGRQWQGEKSTWTSNLSFWIGLRWGTSPWCSRRTLAAITWSSPWCCPFFSRGPSSWDAEIPTIVAKGATFRELH